MKQKEQDKQGERDPRRWNGAKFCVQVVKQIKEKPAVKWKKVNGDPG